MKQIIKIALSALIFLMLVPALAYSQKQLFILGDNVSASVVTDSTILFNANIKIDLPVLKGSENSKIKIRLPVALNLLGQPVTIIKKSVSENNKRNSYTWSGEIEGQTGSYVLFTVVGQAMSGYIRTRENVVYKIEFIKSGIHQISRVSPFYSRPDGIKIPQLDNTASHDELNAECCDSFQVDVLVVYTAIAKDAAGGTDAILSQIYNCETLTNQSFTNSLVSYKIEIVKTAEIDYEETGSAEADLTNLRLSNDNIIDTVHKIREDSKADIVLMLVENTERYWGFSYIPEILSVSFRDYAFGVIKRRVASSHLIFLHELGHVMGCRHEFLDDRALTPFPDSHGYHTASFRTIMSENAQFNYSIEYWSNPAVNYPGTGEPTGNTGDIFRANNSFTLNKTMPFLSRLMCSDFCSQPCNMLNAWWFWLVILALLLSLFLLYKYFRNRNQ